MKALVHSSSVQYAVIQVSSAKDSPERSILAYSDEKSVCELIAEPSIIGLGFASREEAAAAVAGDFRERIVSKQTHGTAAIVYGDQKNNPAFPFGEAGIGRRVRYWKSRSIAYSAVQFAVATAILVLYSRNIVSATIRTVLGV